MNTSVFEIYTLRALRLAPETMGKLLGQISPERYDERLSPERFTLREMIAHLADFEPVWFSRLRAGVEQSGAEVFSVDEDQMAIDGNYATSDPVASLAAFSEGRAHIVQLFASLPKETLSNTVHHSQLGEMTLMELGYLVVGHDAYHLEQVSTYLA